jgi:hypothetical protein
LLAVFFSFFGQQNPGFVFGSGFTWNAGSGSGFSESGSTTLVLTAAFCYVSVCVRIPVILQNAFIVFVYSVLQTSW